MKRHVFALLLLVVVAGRVVVAAAEAAGSLRLYDVRLPRGPETIRVTLAIFNESDYQLRLIDNATPAGKPRFRSLAEAMAGTGCAAGSNGGFFKRSPFEPYPYMIAEGKPYGKFDPNSWMNGLVVFRGETVTLEPAPSLLDHTGIDHLLQTGTWLVSKGAAVTTLDNSKVAPRSFIARDAQGKWALGMTSDCTLAELGAYLRHPQITTAIDIQEAINLDGGPSSGLWFKSANTSLYLREGWYVRNYLGVVPRVTATTATTGTARGATKAESASPKK